MKITYLHPCSHRTYRHRYKYQHWALGLNISQWTKNKNIKDLYRLRGKRFLLSVPERILTKSIIIEVCGPKLTSWYISKNGQYIKIWSGKSIKNTIKKINKFINEIKIKGKENENKLHKRLR